jgi:hypothetical protein
VSSPPRDPDALRWVDLDEPSLGITLQVPDGWSRAEHPHFVLQLLAPAVEGYRQNVSFSIKPIDPPTEGRFREWVDATVDAHARTYEGHEELHRGFIEVGGRAAVAVHYRWEPPQLGRPLESLFVAIPTAPDRLIEIDASAAAAGEDPLAVSRWIVMTIRF